jgi:DNA-binding beta-propeller fold protein YncE
MDAQTLFVLGVADTSFSSNVGKRIYKVDMQTKVIDPNFNIIYTGNNDVYGLAYHSTEQKLYAVNSRSGTANGEVNVYDKNGNLVITYPDIGGKFPKRIAFLNF